MLREVRQSLLPRLNVLFIGGALSCTFLRAKGCQIGASPVDDDFLPVVRDFLRKARGKTQLVLPRDFVVVRAIDFIDFQNGLQSRPPESREALPEEMGFGKSSPSLRVRLEFRAPCLKPHRTTSNGPSCAATAWRARFDVPVFHSSGFAI